MNSFTPISILRWPASFWKCGIECPAISVSLDLLPSDTGSARRAPAFLARGGGPGAVTGPLPEA
jgi:hypothetical protein